MVLMEYETMRSCAYNARVQRRSLKTLSAWWQHPANRPNIATAYGVSVLRNTASNHAGTQDICARVLELLRHFRVDGTAAVKQAAAEAVEVVAATLAQCASSTAPSEPCTVSAARTREAGACGQQHVTTPSSSFWHAIFHRGSGPLAEYAPSFCLKDSASSMRALRTSQSQVELIANHPCDPITCAQQVNEAPLRV
eukprot:2463886-Pleurochrysis_carterae.AAC.3